MIHKFAAMEMMQRMADLHLLSPKGFRAGGAYAGIKSRKINDVGLLVCDRSASVSAAFTTNRVFAAPIQVGREHLRRSRGRIQTIVVNSGNANACTGPKGLVDAREMCRLAAAKARCESFQVLPSSTGIIGHPLPMSRVSRGIVEAASDLGNSAEHALAFGDAILTTDTKRKSAATTLRIGGKKVTIAGICKGAGMIGPRLSVGEKHATMLAYLTTDAVVSPASLRKILQPACDASFNSVTIDDHTSTNDTAVLIASGGSDARISSLAASRTFSSAFTEVCRELARQIAADGEGATKVVRIEISRARTDADAQKIARAIANSPLVKCAMHGNDPNWGRIVSAAGMCGATFDPERATLALGGIVVFRKGQPANFDPAAASESMDVDEVVVNLDCGGGKGSASMWTCDLSKEYVSINADYHT